ncbi:MAG: hypothetical protein ACOCVP_02650 [Wenzhouxiangella sp.]
MPTLQRLKASGFVLPKFIVFTLQFVVLGLAAAFVAVWLRPELLPALSNTAAPSPASFADAVNRTAPSVVSIYTRTLVTEPGRDGVWARA